MDIVLMGGPGSGQGSMAEMTQPSTPHVATGDLFRKNRARILSLVKRQSLY